MDRKKASPHRGFPGVERSLQHRALRLIQGNSQLFHRYIERKVSHTGVFRSQHHMLMHLSKHPDCSQMELAEHMGISPSAVAVTLKKLEKGGYLVRSAQEEDSRVNQITLTDNGRHVVKESMECFRTADEEVFEDFEELEVELLVSLLSRLFDNLEQLIEKQDGKGIR